MGRLGRRGRHAQPAAHAQRAPLHAQQALRVARRGLPVVSSDFPERRRIILDDPAGPLGAVCDPTDPAALAAALAGLLALPPAERAALRARVLAAAHARYTWDHQAGILVAAYAALPGVAA